MVETDESDSGVQLVRGDQTDLVLQQSLVQPALSASSRHPLLRANVQVGLSGCSTESTL